MHIAFTVVAVLVRNKQAEGRKSVSSSSSNFLVEAAKIFRAASVNDCSYVRLINTNAKSRCCNDYIKLVTFPASQDFIPVRIFCLTGKHRNVIVSLLTKLLLQI